MKLLKCFFSLFILSSIAFYCKGQDTKEATSQVKESKNVIHGTIGFIPLYFAGNISYERRFAANSDKFLRSFWLKVSGGAWAAWAVGGPLYYAGITSLTGSGKSHLEFNLGFASRYDKKSYEEKDYFRPTEPKVKSDYYKNSIAGGIGYRFQSPDGGFVFRAGISYPESIYIGLGISF